MNFLTRHWTMLQFATVYAHPQAQKIPSPSQDERVMSLEARDGIEPSHRAFAELGLTTWLPRLNLTFGFSHLDESYSAFKTYRRLCAYGILRAQTTNAELGGDQPNALTRRFERNASMESLHLRLARRESIAILGFLCREANDLLTQWRFPTERAHPTFPGSRQRLRP